MGDSRVKIGWTQVKNNNNNESNNNVFWLLQNKQDWPNLSRAFNSPHGPKASWGPLPLLNGSSSGRDQFLSTQRVTHLHPHGVGLPLIGERSWNWGNEPLGSTSATSKDWSRSRISWLQRRRPLLPCKWEGAPLKSWRGVGLRYHKEHRDLRIRS